MWSKNKVITIHYSFLIHRSNFFFNWKEKRWKKREKFWSDCVFYSHVKIQFFNSINKKKLYVKYKNQHYAAFKMDRQFYRRLNEIKFSFLFESFLCRISWNLSVRKGTLLKYLQVLMSISIRSAIYFFKKRFTFLLLLLAWLMFFWLQYAGWMINSFFLD